MDKQIIAIHSAGAKDGEVIFNVGRLITADLYNNLEKWRKELNGLPFALAANKCPHVKDAGSQ
jgi:hypothetical protein